MIKRGEWLTLRDAPNTLGVVKYVFDNETKLIVSGDYDLTSHTLEELENKWDKGMFHGVELPFWVAPKTMFKNRHSTSNAVAVINEARPGWVSWWLQHHAVASRFFMTPWSQFRRAYEPLNAPTAWARILHDE